MKNKKTKEEKENEEAFEKDWEYKCDVCEAVPTVAATGLCGPCTFGEAETINGNW